MEDNTGDKTSPTKSRANDIPSIFSGRSGRPSSHHPARSDRGGSSTTSSEHGPSSSLPQPPPSAASYTSAASSDATAGVLSPDIVDRVFPMRSFVSVDPTPTADPTTSPTSRAQASGDESYFTLSRRSNVGRQSVSQQGRSGPEFHGTDFGIIQESGSLDEVVRSPPAHHTVGGGGQYQITSDTASLKSDGASVTGGPKSIPGRPSSIISTRTNRDADDVGGLLTARFKHVVTEEGHAVITGRDGETLQRCEDEPIHIPGAVQSFGMLMALHEESEGRLLVKIVSENSKNIIGYTPRQLFALESFTDLLSEEQAENLLDHVDFIKDEGVDVETNGPEVFTISLKTLQRRTLKLWCAIHINTANPDLIICEFELEDDQVNPLVAPNDETPEPPEDTLSSDPTQEELRESTETISRPLRVLRSARRRKGEAATMEVFNIMSQVQEQLAEAPNLDRFLKVLVGVVKELTGFHRVMIYQFDQAWNGKVVTELVDPRATKDLYKGLHFPASDIPRQARDMYRINKVRLLYDRDQETARLVCRTIQELEQPLDLTHSYLRAMSPIHIKYLRNMAVRSSMSISINAFNELWGLISCHTYGSRGTRVSFPIRKMCRLVGDSASRNIERLSYASRLQARKLINTAPTQKNPSGYIIASSEDLLKLFDADFGLLSIRDETKILGKFDATQEALAMLEYLRMRSFTSVLTSLDIREDFPDLRYPPGFKLLAGLLLVPLSSLGTDFIVFFRKGQLKEVKWAGNPYEKFVREGTEGYLEPRKSFKTWSETVVGKCREWSEEEVETAAVLCLVYGKFIEVWRQKEAALENSQLTKLLLANSAHEVRTPLNAIINYLEIALEGSLDQETRENLARSHSASKSLIYVINDLLDLTKTEAGVVEAVRDEPFDLKATFREAVDMFSGEAQRKGIYLRVFEHSHIPDLVLGDQRRVRQAISNVVANAVEATTTGGVNAEILVVNRSTNHADVEVIVSDTGAGMRAERLDAIFAELEQVQMETNDKMIEQAIAPPPPSPTAGKRKDKPLGLGLAVVARVVRNMSGQVRLKSEEGRGSRFVILFPFDLPASEARITTSSELGSESEVSVLQEDPLKAGEVTLVAPPPPNASRRNSSDSGPSSPSPQLVHRRSDNSLDSSRSLNTLKSGRSSAHSARSDVDRLIEAMQEPHMVEGPSDTRPGSKRTSQVINAKGSRKMTGGSGMLSPARLSPGTETMSDQLKSPDPRRALRFDPPGQHSVADSSQPIRAVRVPDEDDSVTSPTLGTLGTPSMAEDVISPPQEEPPPLRRDSLSADNMSVLVAEDDPVNSKIIHKRLQKAGHQVHLTVNGEECAARYGDQPGAYDVVLMDMQMPIVDGISSTKMIRSFEKSHSSKMLSARASLNGRIPIIAVSASLEERRQQSYIDSGFDGWILKPINFQRLAVLMRGIVDQETRAGTLYRPGHWEQGGWFHEAKSDAFDAKTQPDLRAPYADSAEQAQAKAEERARAEQAPAAADADAALAQPSSAEKAPDPTSGSAAT